MGIKAMSNNDEYMIIYDTFPDIVFALIGFCFMAALYCHILHKSFRYRFPLFIQVRLGKQQEPFKLIKFRTMKIGTAKWALIWRIPTTLSHLGVSYAGQN